LTRTTSPLAVYVSVKDSRNHALWNPSLASLGTLITTAQTKLAAYNTAVAVAQQWERGALDPDDAVSAEPALVERVLDEVEVGRVAFGSAGAGVLDGGAPGARSIEAPYLQLVLSRLWDEERREGSHVLRLETLERLGGAERIVRTHLDDALGALSADDQEVAAAVFRFLVTPSGTKIAHRADDLAEYAGHPPEAVASVLERLASGGTRVVRPVGDDAYEIYHDVLAAAVLDWRARYLHAQELAALDLRRRTRWRLAVAALVVAVLAGVAAGLTVWRVEASRTDAANRQAESRQLELARAAQYARSVFTGHRDVLQSIAFSPDGRNVVSADQHGDVRVWTAADGRELARLRLGGDVQQAGFDPDGSLVLAANGKGDVAIWRWRSGERVASLTEQGLDGAVYVMLAHGISTGGLFMLAGILYERRHTYEISEFGGLAAPMPAYSTFFLFILLASVGLPLLNGFIGEFLVLSGAFQAKAWWGVVGATGVIWSACYLLWMYQRVFFGQVKHEENNSLLDLNLRERIALWPAASAKFSWSLPLLRSFCPSGLAANRP